MVWKITFLGGKLIMKKIFIPALLFLFVSSVALAETTFTFGGNYEFGGRYVMNNSLGNDDKDDPATNKRSKDNSAYNFQYLEFDISATVDSFGLYIHANPFDRYIGQLNPDQAGTLNSEYIDRAFATYAFLPNLVFVGGRVLAGGVLADGAAPFAGGYEYLGFGSGAYNTTFSERVNGDGLGIIYVVNDNLNFTFVNERYIESDNPPDIGADKVVGLGADADGYILKANFASGDIVVRPYVSWVTLPNNLGILGDTNLGVVPVNIDKTVHALAAYVGGGYNPASGLSVNAAFGINKLIDGEIAAGLAENIDAGDMPLSFGGYLNVAFAQDIFKVGIEAAYASYAVEENVGPANSGVHLQSYYQFGGDFDRTYIIDSLLFGTSNGIPAMTTIQLYAEITPVEKLTLLPRVAYYFSNVSEEWGEAGISQNVIGLNSGPAIIGEKTTFLEVDLIAQYAWTESTVIYGGLAYAQGDKIGANGPAPVKPYEPDPVFAVVYGLITNF
jgi:hypothetical protein